MDNALALDRLRSRGWLSRAPADFAERLLAGGRIRRLGPTEAVCHLADPSTNLIGLAEGMASVFLDAGPAALRLAFVACPGWWGGTVGAADGTSRRASVIARTSVTTVTVPLAHVEAMARADGQTWRHVATAGASHFDNLSHLLVAHVHPDVRMRVLITLGRLYRFNDGATEFPISQSELAEMAGLSRNSANRAVRQMAAAGLLEVGYGRLRILRPEALADAIAQTGLGP